MVFFSHLLFWYFGFQAFNDYGYGGDASSANNAGAIVSGPSGSGVFPVSLVLMLVATASVTGQAVSRARCLLALCSPLIISHPLQHSYFTTPEVGE